MCEQRRIEVDAEAALLGEFDPRCEVARLECVAVDLLAVGEYGVVGVQVDAVMSGDVRERKVDVSHKLLRRACRAGIVARDLYAAVERRRALKTMDVVALPAVQRDGKCAQARYRGLCIDAERGVCRTRVFVTDVI